MKKLTFAAIACLFTLCSYSQTFMHGAGAGVYVVKADNRDAEASGTLIYSPRLNITETEEMAVSIGIPLTFGFSGSYNYSSNNGSSGTLGFMFNAPLMVNLNMGRGSTKENERGFGYFVGAGFGYHYTTFTNMVEDSYYGDSNNSGSYSAYGPAANAGVRFGVGNSHKNIELLLQYMKGIDDSRANIFGLSALFNF